MFTPVLAACLKTPPSHFEGSLMWFAIPVVSLVVLKFIYQTGIVCGRLARYCLGTTNFGGSKSVSTKLRV